MLPEALDILVVSPTATRVRPWAARRVVAPPTVWEVNWQLKRFGRSMPSSTSPQTPSCDTTRRGASPSCISATAVVISAGDPSGRCVARPSSSSHRRPSQLEQAIESITIGGDLVQLARARRSLPQAAAPGGRPVLPTRDEASTSSVVVDHPVESASRCEVHSHGAQRPVEGLEPKMTSRAHHAALSGVYKHVQPLAALHRESPPARELPPLPEVPPAARLRQRRHLVSSAPSLTTTSRWST